MLEKKLTVTEGQFTVLAHAAHPDGIRKSQMPGRMWRNFDQLVERGLIARNMLGVYRTTDLYRRSTIRSA